MKNKSIWEDYSKKTNQNKEEKNKTNKAESKQKKNKEIENIQTDILIIGAGITGLTTAYFLKDINKKITIIITSGITKLSLYSAKILNKLNFVYNININKIIITNKKGIYYE